MTRTMKPTRRDALAGASTLRARRVRRGRRFQQVYENTVKPGQDAVYENYIKKLIAGYDKVGSKVYWTTYSVMLGKAGGTYRVALNLNAWADREAWGSIPATMEVQGGV